MLLERAALSERVLVDDVMAGLSFQIFSLQELEVTLPFPCSRLALGASDFRKAWKRCGQTNLGLLQVAIDDLLQIWRVLLQVEPGPNA